MKKNRARLLAGLVAGCCTLTPVMQSLTPVMLMAQETETQSVNVGKKGTAWADTEYGASLGQISNLNDGSDSTLWIAGGTEVPVSAGIHLDKIYQVTKVRAAFEPRNSKAEHLGFTISYQDRETKQWIEIGSGSNLNTADDTWATTFELDTPVTASEIKITVTERENTAAWPAVAELEVYADPSTAVDKPQEEIGATNLALHKPVTVSGGSNESSINDGSTGGFWDGGVAPAEFEIDLETGCFIESIKAFPYYGDGRYYHYDIYTSLDGRKFDKVASKNDSTPAKSSGDEYIFETPINARYVRCVMTYNSANPSVHMKEFEVMGKVDPNYVEPEKPTEDLEDPDNIAFGKPVRTNLNTATKDNAVDGSIDTKWTGKFYPSYVDVDLMEEYNLTDAVIHLPVREGRYYWYTVYGSNDYKTWDRLYTKKDKTTVTEDGDTIDLSGKTYRFIRFYSEYCSDSASASLSEIRVHGTPAGTDNKGEVRTGSIDEVMGIKDFDETEYAAPITDAETIENVYGIIERTVGAEYRDWFSFELAENTLNSNDYYEVSMLDGKVHITGSDGVALASGVNWYYKNCCNVNITEQANQTKMPASIVNVEGVVRKETPYKVRYAMNYCTMDYTFAFFGVDDFQKENDYLALNGINVVLDLAGQEATWIKFLQNFGYSVDDAKDWLAGPSYYAWQFMDNLETFGGPVPDGWVKDRLEMARENQRWKRSLGMQTVLQGYAGMVPTNFSDYQDVDILKQGGWCGLDRPDMIRTDGALYDEYAEKFYEAQRWALGDTTNYYAADPFHEGGIRPSDLSDSTIAENVLESMMRYDKDAVWMVQAWWSNPTNELLQGMGEYRQDHVIILDLTGLEAPKWNSTSYGSTNLDAAEFNGTDWVWCMLKNYGGNTSVDGALSKIANDIPEALANSEHMKGIGFISEATYDNPAAYELLLDMVWTDTKVDVDEWLDNYVVRRYGAKSENARKAWKELQKSVYNRQGNTGQILTSSPSMTRSPGTGHSMQSLEKAIKLLLRDYDLLCESEGYRYDLSELIRQHASDYACVKYNEMKAAYQDDDLALFQTKKAEFLEAFDMVDEIAGTQVDMMVGEWIGKAEDWAENYDDFSKDCLPMNAKALITSWASSASAASLPDYAYRHYNGLVKDVYKAKWQVYLDYIEEQMSGNTEATYSYSLFNYYWDWVINTPEYSRTPNNEPAAMKEIVNRIMDNSTVIAPIPDIPENVGNVALGKDVEVSNYAGTSGAGGGLGDYITDGQTDNGYWDSGDWHANPYAIIDLEAVYDLDKFTVINYAGNRYYQWELYVSTDKENWTLACEKKDEVKATSAGTTIELETPARGRYIKLVATYNSANEGWHCRELRAYGTEVVEAKANKILLNMAIEKADALKADGKLEGVNALVVSRFEEALAAAKEVSADVNADQDTVNEAWRNLGSMIHMLEFKTDFTELDALIAECEAIDLSGYPDNEVKEAFIAALDFAKETRQSDTALTDVSIALAIEQLTAARDALTGQVELDTALLEFLVAQVKDTDLTLYVPAGQEEFTQALEAAQNVLAAPETQEQIDAAVDELSARYLALRLRPDESVLAELNAFVEKAQSADLSAYSAADQARITSALRTIQAHLDDVNYDKEMAEKDLDLSREVTAILDKKADVNQSVKPGSQSSASAGNKTAASVKTAAATRTAGLFGAALAAAAGMLALRRRNRK